MEAFLHRPPDHPPDLTSNLGVGEAELTVRDLAEKLGALEPEVLLLAVSLPERPNQFEGDEQARGRRLLRGAAGWPRRRLLHICQQVGLVLEHEVEGVVGAT